MRVVLFDVDGTLIHAPGAGRRALERALWAVAGVDGRRALAGIRFDGMTDRLILREAYRAAERGLGQSELVAVLDRYAVVLGEELRASPFEVLPGVVALLDALAAAGAPVGLGTGNVEPGARAKLAHGGIDHYFRFGGFGEDGETREQILGAALERAGELLGRPVQPGQAVVVGDTPRDVEAARRVGCRAIGIATGRFGVAELESAGADRALPSLSAPAAFDAILRAP